MAASIAEAEVLRDAHDRAAADVEALVQAAVARVTDCFEPPVPLEEPLRFTPDDPDLWLHLHFGSG